MVILSAKQYEQYIQDIQKQIDAADSAAKQKTEEFLNANQAQFQQQVLDRIRHELELMSAAMVTNDLGAAEMHKIRIEVYESILKAFKR